jgi:hypothetical protein
MSVVCQKKSTLKTKDLQHKSKYHAGHGQRFLAMQNAQMQRLR